MICKCGNEIDESVVEDGYAVCYNCAEIIAKDIERRRRAIGSVAAEIQMLQQEIDALNAYIEDRENELYANLAS